MKLVVLGGGTGSFVVLQGLKQLASDISAVVNMCDDGGSTGVLRDELGVLPPGDARQCLVALSDSSEIRDLFSYRFSDGRLEGQSLGNIILSGLELQHGSFEKAIEVASRVLRIRGQVVPVVLGNHQLVLRDGDRTIEGQFAIKTCQIEHPDKARISLEPVSTLNPVAEQAIRSADVVVLAPGDLYSSLLPVFSTPGMAEALSETNAKVVMLANLVNKPGQTDGWHVADYVRKVEEYIGEGNIDIVLYNNAVIAEDLLQKYAADGELPVDTDPARFAELTTRAVGADLLSDTITQSDPADKSVPRTLIRHDPQAVHKHLVDILGDKTTKTQQ